MPADTFSKLPVCALITDLKKIDPKKVISVKTPHLAMWATSLSRPKYFGTSPKLPVHALIHDPQKENLWASTRTHDPFLTTPKFDLLLYIGEKCAKNPYFYHFSWKKEVKLGKNQKKAGGGHQLRTMAYFSKYHTFDPLLYLGCKMLRTYFFLLFLGKTGQITRYLGKKTYGHQLGPMTYFFDNHEILTYFYI